MFQTFHTTANSNHTIRSETAKSAEAAVLLKERVCIVKEKRRGTVCQVRIYCVKSYL